MLLFVIDKLLGPVRSSIHHYIKFSFKNGIEPEFLKAFHNTLAEKVWERVFPLSPEVGASSSSPNASSENNSKIRSGILGIERSIESKNKEIDESIVVAFQDLTKLMEKAKDMVNLSKSISNKIRVSIKY